MAVKTMTGTTTWLRSFRRGLINGPPLSGKTSSLKTLPPRRHILVVPGEMGYSSLLPDDETTVTYWEFEDGKVPPWRELLNEFESEVVKAIQGKPETLAIDGLHKYYSLIMMAFGYSSSSDPSEFGTYHREFINRTTKFLASPVPYVFCTCYDGVEPVEGVKGATQVWPDFPGQMAKRVLGMFPVVFYSQRTAGSPAATFSWRLRPVGKVQGVGLHVPVKLLSLFPDEIPITRQADGSLTGGWQAVEQILAKAALSDQPLQGRKE